MGTPHFYFQNLSSYGKNNRQSLRKIQCRFYFNGMTLRWNGTLYIDQKVCLSLVKKDQLCAIALVSRKLILKVLLKMVAMATSHSLLR